MAFEPQNFVQLSAGEVPPNQTAGCVSFFYESATDNLNTTAPGQLTPGYFDAVASKLRFGSYIACVYKPATFANALTALCVVTSDQPANTTTPVEIKRLHVTPTPSYEVIAEAPLTYVTSGGNTDIVPFPDSEVGFYATYSLNSAINDIGPPLAHSGIEFIECQAGQLLIDYSRPVVAGQTVKLWVQVRTTTPTP